MDRNSACHLNSEEFRSPGLGHLSHSATVGTDAPGRLVDLVAHVLHGHASVDERLFGGRSILWGLLGRVEVLLLGCHSLHPLSEVSMFPVVEVRGLGGTVERREAESFSGSRPRDLTGGYSSVPGETYSSLYPSVGMMGVEPTRLPNRSIPWTVPCARGRTTTALRRP